MRKLFNQAMELRRYYLILLAVLCLGAAPSRTQTYTAGEVISPTEVTENEDNIYQYLQAGVDTYSSGSITASAIASGAVETSELADNSVTSAKIVDATIVTGDIATDGVATADILDNTITATDLNATITFSDSDLIDMDAINVSSATEGLLLPQAASCASGTAEGQICWDTDNDSLRVGTSAASSRIGNLNIDNFQDSTPTNTTENGALRAEFGQLDIAGDSGQSNVTETVTFATAFTTIRAVYITASDQASIVGGKRAIWTVNSETTANFVAGASTMDAVNFTNTNTGTAFWIAIGE